jgi:hypothetical protein
LKAFRKLAGEMSYPEVSGEEDPLARKGEPGCVCPLPQRVGAGEKHPAAPRSSHHGGTMVVAEVSQVANQSLLTNPQHA